MVGIESQTINASANPCKSHTIEKIFKSQCKKKKKGPKRDNRNRDDSGRGKGGGGRNGDGGDRGHRDDGGNGGPGTCKPLEGDRVSKDRDCRQKKRPRQDDDGGGDTDVFVEPPPDVTWEDVGETSIPASDIFVMPEGWGVVNKPIAVWAGNNSSRTETMELAGYSVEIRVTPSEYTWDFGDGNSTTTKSAGRKPRHAHDADISHSYSNSGKYTINLTTSYVGQFRVDGGAWEEIPGTADIPSTPVPVEVYRYVRYLVDEECKKNPEGPDCP